MKIVVLGATGNAGSEIVTEAARRGHTVVAVSRREPTAPLPAGATWQAGDATDPQAVGRLAAEADTVVSALGPSREPGGDPSAFAETLRGIAGAVGNARLAVVGGAGSLEAAPGVRLVDTPEFPEVYKAEALAHSDGLAVLKAADPALDWTYLSPAPILGPGERTGRYRTGTDSPVGESISYADYAIALVDELERPAHVRSRWTVAAA